MSDVNESKKELSSDDIIRRDEISGEYYRVLKEKIENKENIKLGDWLKMIELKRKLSPADAEQKKFWKMLDKIREEELDEPKGEKLKTRKIGKKKKHA